MPAETRCESGIKEIVEGIVAETGSARSDLIPILLRISTECSYISEEAIRQLSSCLRLPESEIFAVATFYHMLLTQAHGRHIVQFCESAPCHVAGGREIFQALKDLLGLKPGETSQDDRWTLFTTSCLGVCGIGPVVMVDTDIYGHVLPEQLPAILENYR